MSRDGEPQVLVSTGRGATSFHLELGGSKLAACGKNAQCDREFDRVSLDEARNELDRDPCGHCPIPDDWLQVDRGDGVLADGGTPQREITATRDEDRQTVLVENDDVAVLATVTNDATETDILAMLSDLDQELALERAVREASSEASDADVQAAVSEAVTDGGREPSHGLTEFVRGIVVDVLRGDLR